MTSKNLPSHIVEINNPERIVPHGIINTTNLISALLKGLVADERLCLLYDYILTSTLPHLPYNIKGDVIKSLRMTRIKDLILGPTFRLCVTPRHIEQPCISNWKQHNRDIGCLNPPINLALCEAYEDTFVDDADASNVLLRGQLGSLIIVTYLHELAHTYLCWALKGIVPADWRIPNLGTQDGDSGDKLEEALFSGKIIAVWKEADLTQPKWFEMIQNIWIQPSHGLMPFGQMYLIPPGNLIGFHNRVLSTQFNLEQLKTPFEDDRTTYTTPARLTAANMRLLTTSKTRAVTEGIPLVLPSIDHVKYPPFCYIGLQRAAERDPKVREKYFGV
ncbi:hypothetical protein B0H12DRAFT_1100958 [Mycena haematopus]|nr:hypothetical protein B0H12DRAFT_1100958 [Mycena haematopus]